MAAYVDNSQQLGLLVVVLIAAAALAFDAQRESGAFLCTRVHHIRQLVLPKVAVNALAAVGAFALGPLAAWYETAVLLGGLPVAEPLAAQGVEAPDRPDPVHHVKARRVWCR
jgi:ABC-2 type transport system permease protein